MKIQLWEPPAELRTTGIGEKLTKFEVSHPKIQLNGIEKELISSAEDFPTLAVIRRVKTWLAQAFENPTTGKKTITIPFDARIQVYDHQFFETPDAEEYALTKFGWILTSNLKRYDRYVPCIGLSINSWKQFPEFADSFMPPLKPSEIVNLFDEMKVDYTNMRDLKAYAPNQELALSFEILFDVFDDAANEIVSYLNSDFYTGLFLLPAVAVQPISYRARFPRAKREISFTVPTHLTTFPNGMILGHGQRTCHTTRYSWIVGKKFGDYAILQTYDGQDNFKHMHTIMIRQIAFSDRAVVKIIRESDSYAISDIVSKCSLEEHVAFFGPGMILDTIKLSTEVENSFVKGWEMDSFKARDTVDRIAIANEHFAKILDEGCNSDDEVDLEDYATCNEFDWTRKERETIVPSIRIVNTVPIRREPRRVVKFLPNKGCSTSAVTGLIQNIGAASKSRKSRVRPKEYTVVHRRGVGLCITMKKCGHRNCSHNHVDPSPLNNESTEPALQIPSTHEINLAEKFEENRQVKKGKRKGRKVKKRKGDNRKSRKNKSKVLKQREIRKQKKRMQQARQFARDTKTLNLDYLYSPYINIPYRNICRCWWCLGLPDPRVKKNETKTEKSGAQKALEADLTRDFSLQTWKFMGSKKSKKERSRDGKSQKRKAAKAKRSKDRRQTLKKAKFARRANAKRFIGSIAA